ALRTGAPAGPGADAQVAVAALRPSRLPTGARPTGPGRRDRGRTHAAAALRTMVVRTRLLGGLVPEIGHSEAKAAVDDLLRVVEDALVRCSAALRGSGPAPEGGPVVAGIAH